MRFSIIAVDSNRPFRECRSLAMYMAARGSDLSGISVLPNDDKLIRNRVLTEVTRNELLIISGDLLPSSVLPASSETVPAFSSPASWFSAELEGCEILFLPSGLPQDQVREVVDGRLEQDQREVLGVCGLSRDEIMQRLRGSLREEELENISILGGAPGVNYIFAPGDTEKERLNAAADRLGSYLFTRENRSLSSAVLYLLKERDMTLVTAESITGGLLCSEIVSVPGASRVFMEGFVTYSNEAKVETLDIDPESIKSWGAVSREVCLEMAEAAASIRSADYAISTTGIAGPGGATPEKEVGLCYIGLRTPNGIYCAGNHFAGGRERVRWMAVISALDILRLSLLECSERLEKYKSAESD